ncbi:MAG: hypothetical protein AAFX93_07660 [Verrucomicrobiota bacterium]
MPEIDFRLSPFFLQALKDVLEPVSKSLRLQVAIKLRATPDDDELLEEAWRDSLLEHLNEDLAELLQLLEELSGESVLRISDGQAESLLRAASAIRLKIREVFLSELSEYDLEQGSINVAKLRPEQHKPYACFGFLASFQERLVVQLMPDFYDDESI